MALTDLSIVMFKSCLISSLRLIRSDDMVDVVVFTVVEIFSLAACIDTSIKVVR